VGRFGAVGFNGSVVSTATSGFQGIMGTAAALGANAKDRLCLLQRQSQPQSAAIYFQPNTIRDATEFFGVSAAANISMIFGVNLKNPGGADLQSPE